MTNFFFILRSVIFRQKWVFVSAIFILFCFWMGLQHTARQGVNRSLAEQEVSNSVLLHALEDSVVRSFKSVNSSLKTLAESLANPAPGRNVHQLLREQLRSSLQLRSIEVLSRHGRVLASATNNQKSQETYACINELNSDPLTEFVIEAPRQGRYPNDPFAAQSVHRYIPFCIPVRDAKGQVSQILLASINPEYFYNLFASITHSFASSIHLYHFDGQQLLTTGVVEPSMQTLLAQVKNKSWGQFRSPIDGSDYLISYRSTSLLPFILVLVSDEAVALAAWRHDEAVMRSFLLIVSIITVIVAGVIAIMREKRRQALGDIHLLSTAISSTANAIFITDKHGDIYWVNDAFTQLTGYKFEEVNGKNPRILNSGHQPKAFYRELWMTILSGASWRGEVVNHDKQGNTLMVEQTITPILDKENNIEHFVAVHEDMTARKNAEQKALYLADHDVLTGLANRRYFERYLQQILNQTAFTELAVIFIDLDRFKDINDTMGHAAGDALLIHTADNLRKIVDKHSLLARLGGDEFAILLKDITSQQQVTQLVSGVVAAVTQSFYYADHVFNMTCSAGVAMGDNHSADSSTLLRQADMAMYRAKLAGKNTFRFFDETMDELVRRRVYLQRQLESAVSCNQAFSLRYQPQVHALTGQLYGVEALMRWQLADGEWVSPAEFIPLAEETGQIIEVGTWLMTNLFQQVADWNRRGIQVGKVSMNISAVQLARDNLAERMLLMMQEFAIPAAQLSVEITETTLMTRSNKVTENLKQLKSAGISLSIDDFGTGYSSMSYLKDIDANQLKIDRSFIIGIGGPGSDEHIVRATIALAHSLNLKTVAEGVDSQEQLAFLQALSCDYIQGYLFAKPLTKAELEHFITEQPADAIINTGANSGFNLPV